MHQCQTFRSTCAGYFAHPRSCRAMFSRSSSKPIVVMETTQDLLGDHSPAALASIRLHPGPAWNRLVDSPIWTEVMEVVPDIDVLNDGRHRFLGIVRDAIGVKTQRNDGYGSELDALMAGVKTLEDGQDDNDAEAIGRRDAHKHEGDSWITGARFCGMLLADGGQ